MKGIIKTVIIGSIVIAVGVAILLITLACNGWSFGAPKFEMQTFTATENDTKIVIKTNAGTIKTEFYDGDKIEICYPTAKGFTSEISEKDGVFKYENKNNLNMFFYLYKIPETVIKLPKEIIFDAELELNAGTLYIAEGGYGNVKIEVNAGTLSANDITCGNFDCELNAGTISAKNIACDKFDCDVSAGTLNLKGIACPDIKAEISAGSIEMSVDGVKADYTISVSLGSCNLSNQSGATDKILKVDCSAGSVNVTFAG